MTQVAAGDAPRDFGDRITTTERSVSPDLFDEVFDEFRERLDATPRRVEEGQPYEILDSIANGLPFPTEPLSDEHESISPDLEASIPEESARPSSPSLPNGDLLERIRREFADVARFSHEDAHTLGRDQLDPHDYDIVLQEYERVRDQRDLDALREFPPAEKTDWCERMHDFAHSLAFGGGAGLKADALGEAIGNRDRLQKANAQLTAQLQQERAKPAVQPLRPLQSPPPSGSTDSALQTENAGLKTKNTNLQREKQQLETDLGEEQATTALVGQALRAQLRDAETKKQDPKLRHRRRAVVIAAAVPTLLLTAGGIAWLVTANAQHPHRSH
jgi:hypothetical protein